jgi:hypothetical protein
MFRNSYRGTLIWMFIVGVALALTMLAGEVPAEIAAVLLGAYLGLAYLVVRNVQLGSVTMPWIVRGKREKEPTEVAREAMARARSDPNYDALIRLLDVGLIVDEQRPDGMSLRRGRFVSLDDDGLRPFAIVSVPEALGSRLGHIRFEIRDETDHLHYAFEEEKWLQAGENILLPDYRFPIRKKAAELDPGAWTARILVDGGVLGIHHFSVSPSLVARRLQMGADGELMRERVWRTEEDDESLPLSLEELLRQQSRQQRKN